MLRRTGHKWLRSSEVDRDSRNRPATRMRHMPLERGPDVQGVPVTARNWQDPPANRWAFWHVAEILPTYRVSRGPGPARDLPAASVADDPLMIAVTRADGSAGTVDDVLADTYTDA